MTPKANTPLIPQRLKSNYVVVREKNGGSSSNATKSDATKGLQTAEKVTVLAQRSTKGSYLPHYMNGQNASIFGNRLGQGHGLQAGIEARQNKARAAQQQMPTGGGMFSSGMGADAGMMMAMQALNGGMGLIGQGLSAFRAPAGTQTTSSSTQTGDGTQAAKSKQKTSADKSSAGLRTQYAEKKAGIKGICDSVNGLDFSGITSAGTTNIQSLSELDLEPKIDLSNILESLNGIDSIQVDTENPSAGDIQAIATQTEHVSSALDLIDSVLRGSLSDASFTKISAQIAQLGEGDSQAKADLQNKLNLMTAAKRELTTLQTKCKAVKDVLKPANGKPLAEQLQTMVEEKAKLEKEEKAAETEEKLDLSNLKDEANQLLNEIATGSDKKSSKALGKVSTMIAQLQAAKTIVSEHSVPDETLIAQADSIIAKLQSLQTPVAGTETVDANAIAESFELQVGQEKTINGTKFLVDSNGDLKIDGQSASKQRFTTALAQAREDESATSF